MRPFSSWNLSTLDLREVRPEVVACGLAVSNWGVGPVVVVGRTVEIAESPSWKTSAVYEAMLFSSFFWRLIRL